MKWLSRFIVIAAAAAAQAQAQPLPEPPWQDSVAQRARACTACHGSQGQGHTTADGYVPRLAGKPTGYLFDQMQAFRDGRRAHRGMARLLEEADDALLRELAGYFAALSLPYPPPSANAPAPVPAQRAQQIVRQGLPQQGVPACSSCHGATLTGVAPQVPGLLGLPRGYLLAQLGAWREGARHAREPDCMATVARRLPAADLTLLADWLAAQPVPAAQAQATVATTPAPELRCAPAQAAAVPAEPVLSRGAYLARVGNCAGCHQRRGSNDLSGGDALATPFGNVYAGNLTPDPGTGLGAWSADDFWRALHEGRGRDGRRLIPAFPYTSYTHLTRADSDALFAHLRSLAPVQRQPPRQGLRFPYGTQTALTAWQWLFFKPAPPAPAAGDAPLARGRYLVEGLGHCLECHAARGRWGNRGDDPAGALMPMGDGWAPSLHPRPGQSEDALVALLRDGRNSHGSAVGPMATVVRQSTSGWNDADLRAAARYLMSLPPQAAAAPAPAAGGQQLALGRKVYEMRCAGCHGQRGEGAGNGAVAPLAGNPSVLQPQLQNLVQMLRWGGFGAATPRHPLPFGMPPMALSVAEQAAVLSYIRQAWGNAAPAVSEVELVVLE